MAPVTFLTANNATAVTAAAIDASATQVQLVAGYGALFPSPGAGEATVCTFTDVNRVLREIVHVTSRTGDVLTIVRAQEGTTALSWAATSLFEQLWTDGQVENLPQWSKFGSAGLNSVTFATFADVQDQSLLLQIILPAAILTSGWLDVADGGGATYKRVLTEPDVPAAAKFQVGTTWYELSVDNPSPVMFGGTGYKYTPYVWKLGSAAGKVDSYQAVMDCINYAVKRGAKISSPGLIFVVRTYIQWLAGYNNVVGSFFALDMSESTTIRVNSGENLMYLRGADPTYVGSVSASCMQGENIAILAPSATTGLVIGDQLMIMNDLSVTSQTSNYGRNVDDKEIEYVDHTSGQLTFTSKFSNDFLKNNDFTSLHGAFTAGALTTTSGTITAASWSGGTATLTTNAAHGINVGDVVTVSTMNPSGYNGVFTATSGTTGSTLKYAVAADPGAYVSGGAWVKGVYWLAGTATVTTSIPHGINVGDVFVIAASTPIGYNGVFTATAGTTGSTLKYALATDPGAYVIGGTWDARFFTGYTDQPHGLLPQDGSLDGQTFTLTGFLPSGINGNWEALDGTTGNVIVWAPPSNPGTPTSLGTLDYNLKIYKLSTATSFNVEGEFVIYGAGGSPSGTPTTWQRAFLQVFAWGSSWNRFTMWNCERGSWAEDSCEHTNGNYLISHGCSNYPLSAYPISCGGSRHCFYGTLFVERMRHGWTGVEGQAYTDTGGRSFGSWPADDITFGNILALSMWGGVCDTHPATGMYSVEHIYATYNVGASTTSGVSVFSQGAGFQVKSAHVVMPPGASVAGHQSYGWRVKGFKLAAELGSLVVEGQSEATNALFIQNLSNRNGGGTSQESHFHVKDVQGCTVGGMRTSPTEGNSYLYVDGGQLTCTGDTGVRATASGPFESEIRVRGVKFDMTGNDSSAYFTTNSGYTGAGPGAQIWATDCGIYSPTTDTTMVTNGGIINSWNTYEVVTGTPVHTQGGGGRIYASSVALIPAFIDRTAFTPTFSCDVPGTLVVNYADGGQVGFYSKIGPVVTIEISLNLSSVIKGTATGAIRISIPLAAGAPSRASLIITYISQYFTWGAGRTQVGGNTLSNQSYVNIYQNGSGIFTIPMDISAVADNQALRLEMSGQYMTNS